MHSSEIALVRARDDKMNHQWHQRHKARSRRVASKDLETVLEAERAGTAIEAAVVPVQLAHLACAYPYSHAHKRSLRSGFYEYPI